MTNLESSEKETSQRYATKNLDTSNAYLVESAWEVCNQIGGIHTVLRSKAPLAVARWGENYCMLGPYFAPNVASVFDPLETQENDFGKAAKKMREEGYEAYYGTWLITGRPKVVLLNPTCIYHKLDEIKYFLWKDYDIGTPTNDSLLNQVVAFSHLAFIFFQKLVEIKKTNQKVIAHFHEWMAGLPIPMMRRYELPIATVFTTHATLAGRYLAMNEPRFYENLPQLDWLKSSQQFAIESQVKIERAAAHGAHVLSTVSDVTAKECKYLLGRAPDVILPNGINIDRFTALHELQNLHFEFKEKINQFVIAHFFQHHTFDLDNTLYFFTSGRFEYRNKGFDISLMALKKLNQMLKDSHSEKSVVMFFITRQPFSSINPQALQSRGIMEELRQTCKEIQDQVGAKLFYSAAYSTDPKVPILNDFVDDYWKLRYRRTLQSWKSDQLPLLVTHNLEKPNDDPILQFARAENMLNKEDDRVKIVYHPDFITTTNPLLGMEYGQFVRGCHLGIFPSYYEPWGYTPLECIASGVPAITSDLAGFGDYVLKTMPDHAENGVYVINRMNKDINTSANQLAYIMYNFLQLNRRERIEIRNKVDSISYYFDWHVLYSYYENSHQMAFERS